MEHFKFIKPVTWEEVFEGWRKREANRPEWQECAMKVKGWASWEEWRRFMASQFLAEKRAWKLYRILNPGLVLPQFRVGPFQGWHLLDHFSAFPKVPMKERTFAKAAQLFPEKLEGNPKIKDIMRDFPHITEMIGIQEADGAICMEGSHRSSAVALAEALHQPIDFSRRHVYIVLGSPTEDDEALFVEMLERGSDRVKTAS